MKRTCLVLILAAAIGCHHHNRHDRQGHGHRRGTYDGPPADRPFPVGQVTDAHWETQQTNAEAADFIFYDHEFRYDTKNRVDSAELTPGAKKHLMQVALRAEHVPFPIVIEESPHNARPQLDQARRRTIIEQLGRLGLVNVEERVVVGNAFPAGYTGVESEGSYYNVIGDGFGGGAGRRFGGSGGMYR